MDMDMLHMCICFGMMLAYKMPLGAGRKPKKNNDAYFSSTLMTLWPCLQTVGYKLIVWPRGSKWHTSGRAYLNKLIRHAPHTFARFWWAGKREGSRQFISSCCQSQQAHREQIYQTTQHLMEPCSIEMVHVCVLCFVRFANPCFMLLRPSPTSISKKNTVHRVSTATWYNMTADVQIKSCRVVDSHSQYQTLYNYHIIWYH